MRLGFGIIVYNGDFFLKQVLQSIYPFAYAICIAEGPVEFHYRRTGRGVSTDNTVDIIKSFPDPQKKIKLVQGIWEEKDQQCRAWFNMMPEVDYVICNDADEIHTPENLQKLITYLELKDPTSVGFKSDSFFGGFDRIIGGFEREHSFKRVLKYVPGCQYKTHRQPALCVGDNLIEGRDVHGNELYADTMITMWHGSYVSPVGVMEKINYYESAVIAPGKCIPYYFRDLWLKWVLYPDSRDTIEDLYNGVQEFIPQARGECKTLQYPGPHPEVILNSSTELINKFRQQLKEVRGIYNC